MLTATKEFTWDMAHMLCEHEGLCKNLHGHTYKMEVTVAAYVPNGTMNEGPAEGMVVDFSELKTIVQKSIVAKCDHATIINRNTTDSFEKELHALLKAYNKRVVTLPFRPTAELMAAHFLSLLQTKLQRSKAPYQVIKIRLYETPTSYAEVTA